MPILRGPQAGMAMSMGLGRRLPHARSLAVRVNSAETERVLAAWEKAREKGKKRAKMNGVHQVQEKAAPVEQEAAQELIVRPDVEKLPADYLASCIREARRRLDEEVKRRTDIDEIAKALVEAGLSEARR